MYRPALVAFLLVLGSAPAALAQPTPSPGAAVPPISFTVRTLPNGLKVYASVDKTTPDVTVQVFYGVGSKDDPPGRSGFAHLFEHLMFKGSRDMPPEFLDRLTEDVGGENNASTWDDFTEFHEVIPANHLQRLLWAEAERMSSLVVDEANFKSERQVVEEELRQRVLADPYGRLFALALPEASFRVHPYHRPGIGSIEDLDASSLADVRAFHATYYRPDDASLIVVGNFDPKDLDRWVDAYFGPIPTPARPVPRVDAVEPPRSGPGTYDAHGPNVPLPAIAITWLGPARSSPDSPALQIAEAILGQGDSSRLNLDLVHDQQLASQVFADADLKLQPGAFEIGAVLSDGKSLGQGETALRAEVGWLREELVGEAELSRAKNQLIAQALRERETVEGRGQALGMAIGMENEAAAANQEIPRLQAVTAADVQRVARLYLADDKRMVIRYQAESAKPAGQATAPPPSDLKISNVLTPDVPLPVALAPEGQRQPPPMPGTPVKAVLPTPVERALPNGLRVIVAKSTDLPMVTAELTVGAGGAADPARRAGLANLTASLLVKGAAGRSAAEVARDVEALGGSLDEGASWDGSKVTLNVLAANLDKAAPILADVVRRPTLSADELERLRRQASDDLKVDLQDPGELGRYAAAVAVFGGTPYGHVLGGTPASLKRIAQTDVQAFHARWYRPDNAILVLTGDIEPEQGFALAERVFGDWKAPAEPLPKPKAVTPLGAPEVIVIDLPGTGQASVGLAMPAIARKDARFFDAIVANAILGGGYSARLNQEIRIKRGLSYGAASAIDARREVGPFVARAQTRNDATPEVAGLLIDQVKALRAAPAAADEIQARQATITGTYGRTLETTQGLADTLSTYALQGVPLAQIDRYDSDVRSVTPAAAQAFATKALDPAKADVIVVGDAKAFIGPLRAKFPRLKLIEAAQLDLDSPTLVKAVSSGRRPRRP
jgi:zinc protease